MANNMHYMSLLNSRPKHMRHSNFPTASSPLAVHVIAPLLLTPTAQSAVCVCVCACDLSIYNMSGESRRTHRHVQAAQAAHLTRKWIRVCVIQNPVPEQQITTDFAISQTEMRLSMHADESNRIACSTRIGDMFCIICKRNLRGRSRVCLIPTATYRVCRYVRACVLWDLDARRTRRHRLNLRNVFFCVYLCPCTHNSAPFGIMFDFIEWHYTVPGLHEDGTV